MSSPSRPRALARAAAAIGVALCVAVALGGARASTGSPDAAARRAAAPRPNIVFLILDDIPALDGRWWQFLPALRQRFFSPAATQFVHADTETEMCCPGRAGYLTGQHTWKHGVVVNDGRLFKPQGSLPVALHDAGYTTILTGKYFNMMAKTMDAGRPQGWDFFDGIEGNYYDYTLWHFDPAHPAVSKLRFGSDAGSYSTDVIASRAVAALRAAPADRPVFAWIAPYAPHNDHGKQLPSGEVTAVPAARYATSHACDAIPLWDPPSYNRAMTDPPGYIRRTPVIPLPSGFPLRRQCLSLLAVDDLLRKVQGELRREGRLGRTLFVLAGDNGMSYGAHKLLGKVKPYGTRVPLSIVLPASLRTQATPSVVQEQVMNIDVPVTLAAVAGTQLGPYANGQTAPDGLSLLPLLQGAGGLDRDVVIEDWEAGVRWRALRTTAQSPLARRGCPLAASGGCRWHYVWNGGGFQELYDVSGGDCYAWQPGMPGDPCELVNLAHERRYAPIVAALQQRLVEIRGA